MHFFKHLCRVSSETLKLLRGKILNAEDHIINPVQIHNLGSCNIFIIPCCTFISASDKDNWVCSFARSSGTI